MKIYIVMKQASDSPYDRDRFFVDKAYSTKAAAQQRIDRLKTPAYIITSTLRSSAKANDVDKKFAAKTRRLAKTYGARIKAINKMLKDGGMRITTPRNIHGKSTYSKEVYKAQLRKILENL